ncbi:Lcl domain-containing protein [Legionella hackeliae]|uniref:Lcl domain-containing protein n=1 Tax=Legionella hackeliae TaxID=449 RepID=UPI001E2F8E21|nr:DUF1566 domain-containing protein [Legionella hackeliae]
MFNATTDCAALRCRAIHSDWYLPARNELSTVLSVLCSNRTTPCNFGGFSSPPYYWSSSQGLDVAAWAVGAPLGDLGLGSKIGVQRVRCVRTFTS